MTTHETKCKFCHKPITLKVDPKGMALCRDLRLLELAACNRCADLRTTKIDLTAKINRVCRVFMENPATRKKKEELNKKTLKVREIAERKLIHLLQLYCQLISNWTGKPVPTEHPEVDFLIQFPDRVYNVLQRLWPESTQMEMRV